VRNLVVCCDGTWNRFGTNNTNVVHLCSTLVRDPAKQIVYYDPGVGSLGEASMLTRLGRRATQVLGGAIGRGLGRNVEEAYDFVANHYEEGDRVWLFGFSRGAYTARATAGMLHMFGSLDPGNEHLTPYVWGLYSRNDGGEDDEAKQVFRVAREFHRTFARTVPIHFVGVFDTVSSVGWFWDPLTLFYSGKNPAVAHLRHAVAIDERRAFFRQNQLTKASEAQDLVEVWFPGVHCDVGGGYGEAESGPSKVALEWMLGEAEACGLLVDAGKKAAVLGAREGCAKPDPAAPLHDSMNLGWGLLEFLPRLRWSSETRSRRVRMNLFKRRRMPEGALLHASVKARMAATGYAPANLPRQYSFVSTRGSAPGP
jgi:uncharacterized protein (DUF2235 family)